MTELFLNGHLVILDKKASIKVVFDNPYFTKSSTYTHNISLPLSGCKQNQLVFRHVDRADVAKRTQTLKAVLISDNKVLVNGTAVVTEITDVKVQVQLLSGNSELNFFTSGDKYIDELKMIVFKEGKIDFVLGRDQDLFFGPPEKTNIVYFPVFNEDAGEVYNKIIGYYRLLSNGVHQGLVSEELNKCCIQPYLGHVIKSIIEAIGYNLIENQLEGTIFNYLFVCNASIVDWLDDLLPHWTINEFFTQLEQCFGLFIVVDEGNKSIRILLGYNYFTYSDPVFLKNVITSFSAKIDSKETIGLRNANVGFSLPDSEGLKLDRVDEDIMKNMEIKKYGSMDELMNDYNSMNDFGKGRFIFETNNRQYARYSNVLTDVNRYRNLIRNTEKEELDIELKIVPVGMRKEAIEIRGIFLPNEEQHPNWTSETIMPSMKGAVYKGGFNESPSFQDWIDGYEQNKYKPGIIQVAFNLGEMKHLLGPNQEWHIYPIPFTDGSDKLDGQILDFPNWNLRLVDTQEAKFWGNEVFEKVNHINTTAEESKQFISHEIYDPKSVFFIGNKKFVCKSIEIEANLNGIVPLQQATMYELLE